MNIYEKLQSIKLSLLQSNLKKTGENKFAKYKYYELADVLPTIVRLCNEAKVFTSITFTEEVATLVAVNAEAPEEVVSVSSPMRTLDLKGCNEIQALGGIETYQRRYLYMALFDIVENDMFDGVAPEQNKPKEYKCVDCGKPFEPLTDKNGKVWNAGQVYHMAENNNSDKKARCKECRMKHEKGE